MHLSGKLRLSAVSVVGAVAYHSGVNGKSCAVAPAYRTGCRLSSRTRQRTSRPRSAICW